MKTCNRAHERAVHAVATKLLRAPAVELEPIPTYPDSIVYRLRLPERSMIFKAHDPDGRDVDRVAAEAWAMERASSRGVPTPAVVTVDTTSAVFPGSYFVMTDAEGVPLDALRPDEVAAVAVDLGRALSRLHQEEVGGFGQLHVEGAAVRGEHDLWSEFVMSGLQDALAYLEARAAGVVGSQRLREVVERLVAELPMPSRSALLHGDLGENHVFVDPATREITAIVDFGEASAGDFAWDLLEIHRPLVSPVLDGYGVAPAERDAIERRVVGYALLKAVPWAAKWHSRGEISVLEWLQLALDQAENL